MDTYKGWIYISFTRVKWYMYIIPAQTCDSYCFYKHIMIDYSLSTHYIIIRMHYTCIWLFFQWQITCISITPVLSLHLFATSHCCWWKKMFNIKKWQLWQVHWTILYWNCDNGLSKSLNIMFNTTFYTFQQVIELQFQ
jgi:hypothetical protein